MRVTGCKDMFKKQHLIFAIGLSLAAGAAAGAESAPTAADPPGFYGGVSLRSSGREADGLSFGHLSSVWSRFTLPTSEDAAARTLAYGGYRWANDLSVEAALATVDRYSLQPALTGARRGVGLSLGNDIDVGGKALESRYLHELGIPQEFFAVWPPGLHANRFTADVSARIGRRCPPQSRRHELRTRAAL
jgi:hypothetical protein